jgi:hypothetical protein
LTGATTPTISASACQCLGCGLLSACADIGGVESAWANEQRCYPVEVTFCLSLPTPCCIWPFHSLTVAAWIRGDGTCRYKPAIEDALKEPAYSLFLYVDKTLITALGIAVHELDGSDAEKISALQKRVSQDYKTAKRHKVTKRFEWREYESLMRLGRQLEIFEEIFRDGNAPLNPLVVITPIVDGTPKILAITALGPMNIEDFRGTPLEEPGVMVDYLKAYVKEGCFDIARLINDDYFLAIKLLFNARHYVSAAKLLMSFIDTVAFIDEGDVRDGFARWLDRYAALTALRITPKELWEFRNGLLHMTNLRSRAVASGNTAPLIFYVGTPSRPIPSNPSGAKYFSLKGLMDIVAAAISKWIETYNSNPEKLTSFVERYDLTISDARVAYMKP